MRNRIAAALRRWAYRIEGHRPEHRAGETVTVTNLATGRDVTGIMGGGGAGGPYCPPDRRESRGWN